jgi:DNA anti-recombination protein RmuC
MLLPIVFSLLLLAFFILVFLLWKLRNDLRETMTAPQAYETDISVIKNQLQSLPAAFGDLVAVKSQVETVAATMRDIGGIKSQVETISGQAQSITGIRSQVETLSTSVQHLSAIKSGVELISQTVQQIGSIKTELENVKKLDAQLDDTTRRIANKLIGTREVGEAGENILAEIFTCFPPDWIERDFRVGGKVVEFALVLPNHKRLPIDSKFPASQLLEQLGQDNDPVQRQKLIRQIEDAVLSKAKEAAKYIDPAQTIYLAIAAIPDAAYSVCRKSHFEAIKSHVLVVSYSLTLPILLALYKFQLQYGSVDQQNLELHLRNVEACLNAIEKELQNSVGRAGTMITNACNECMTQIGKVRSSLSALRNPSLPSEEQNAEQLNAQ